MSEILMAICGYEGDRHQIQFALPHHESMGFPIVILSPEDSPIQNMGGYWCVQAGKRAYIGEDSLIRQRLQLQRLYEMPFSHYLIHDSDSACLSRTLPQYLFDHDALWSNIVPDLCHKRPPPPEWPYPRLAFQPPYFMSRGVLKKFLDHAGRSQVKNLQTPYIDYWMMAVAHEAPLQYEHFRDGLSCTAQNPDGLARMRRLVAQGDARFVHAIKTEPLLHELIESRRQFAKRHSLPE